MRLDTEPRPKADSWIGKIIGERTRARTWDPLI